MTAATSSHRYSLRARPCTTPPAEGSIPDGSPAALATRLRVKLGIQLYKVLTAGTCGLASFGCLGVGTARTFFVSSVDTRLDTCQVHEDSYLLDVRKVHRDHDVHSISASFTDDGGHFITGGRRDSSLHGPLRATARRAAIVTAARAPPPTLRPREPAGRPQPGERKREPLRERAGHASAIYVLYNTRAIVLQ